MKKTERTTKSKKITKATRAPKTPRTKTVKKTSKKVSAPKKAAPKKSVSKKTVKKRVVKAPLVHAADWQVFYAVNGAVLHTLQDLFYELETMQEGEYLYHKNTGDHFVIWVREVLGDDACAKDLVKASSRKKARTVLKKHLSRYKL